MISVFEQWAKALVMLYGGLMLGLCYEILRCFRFGSFSKPRIAIVDCIFCLCFFILLSLSLLIGTQGELRFYALFFFVAGFILFRKAFSPLFTGIMKKIHKK